jgi:hypothetical protein
MPRRACVVGDGGHDAERVAIAAGSRSQTGSSDRDRVGWLRTIRTPGEVGVERINRPGNVLVVEGWEILPVESWRLDHEDPRSDSLVRDERVETFLHDDEVLHSWVDAQRLQERGSIDLSRPLDQDDLNAVSLDDGDLPDLGFIPSVPERPGPRRAHKLSLAVVDALAASLAADPSRNSASLARIAEERFGIIVHRRSVERALARRKRGLRGPG